MSQLSGNCPTLTFRVDRDNVRTTAATTFAGGSCGRIKRNTNVTVRGVRQASGQILASRVAQTDRDNKDD